MEYSVQIKNLTKEYKTKTNKTILAVNNINLSIKSGSFFGLIGPNGAGKSTIINTIAGIVKRTHGSISINNYDIDKDWINFKRSIGIVPQDLVFDPFFTIKDTLNYYSGFYGIQNKDKKINEIIEMLGLEEKINEKPRSLSGGMKRRLLIAKAIIHSPQVIVFDEPTAGLDIESRHKMWNCIKNINNSGATIILTTHYMEEIERFCDNIAIIKNGNIVMNCTKKELFNRFGTKTITITINKEIQEKEQQKLELLGAEIISKNKISIKSFKETEQNTSVIDIFKEIDWIGAKIIDIEELKSNAEDIIVSIIKKNKGNKY